MESDGNSEKWSPPSENKNPSKKGSQPETKSFFEQECLQKTWMNIKLATWIKGFIVAAVLIALAACITPKHSTAKSPKPQKSINSEQYRFEKGSWIDANECFID